MRLLCKYSWYVYYIIKNTNFITIKQITNLKVFQVTKKYRSISKILIDPYEWRKGWDSTTLALRWAIARTMGSNLPPYIKKNAVYGVPFLWRKGWDSNPCARNRATAFRVRLVMTTSIPFRIFY